MCGNESTQTIILSTSAFGSSQLDTRPPAPEGYSIEYWIQRCPSCGYCAGDIAEGKKELMEVVQRDSYRKQLQSPDFPELANSFLCHSLLEEEAGEYPQAGLACIHAAWACDDAENDTAAQECRKKAVVFLKKAKEKGQQYHSEVGGQEALMVDLLRRSGRFDIALGICEQGLKLNTDKVISDVLQFQIVLIKQADIGAHYVSQCHKEPEEVAAIQAAPSNQKDFQEYIQKYDIRERKLTIYKWCAIGIIAVSIVTQFVVYYYITKVFYANIFWYINIFLAIVLIFGYLYYKKHLR